MQRSTWFALFFLSISAFSQSDYDKLLQQYHQSKNFNGVVLVASNGKADFLGSKGWANRQHNVPFKANTPVKVASITKTFTAVMILQLVEKGLIDLNASISTYLPSYKGEGKDKVNIRHLLTYSSGIPNCEGNTGLSVYQLPLSVDAFIYKYCSGPLEFEPGSRFNYNNGDYILLGRIIEQVTGTSFTKALSAYILRPLGMMNTGMLAAKDIIPGLASTYNYDDSTKAFYTDDPYYIENYFAAGAMYSTAEDLLRFDKGIFEYKLLSKRSVDLMLTPFPELYGVALGFWVYENKIGSKSFRMANRQGSIWGANANWLHLIDNNKTVIVLSNTNATNLPEMTDQLLLIATRQKTTVETSILKKNR